MAVEVFVPKMSDHMEAAEIIRWLVDEGDQVKEGQIILEVMTDKVEAELVAEASGVLKGIRAGAEKGAIVPVGETIAFISGPKEAVPVLSPLGPAKAPQSKGAPQPDSPLSAEPAQAPLDRVQAVPAARRLAKELHVDLGQVRGTGPGGRIRERDVQTYAAAQTTAAFEASKGVKATPVARRVARELGIDLFKVKGSGPGGRIREQDVRAFANAASVAAPRPAVEEDSHWLELTPIQRLTGQRMLMSVQQAPQFTLEVDVDMTQTVWLRDALVERILADTGERPSITAILIGVVAAALKQHPRANASFIDGRVKQHQSINIGVAVGTDEGLVVPVVKEADQKPLAQIVRELKTFRDKAQELRFKTEDLSGGTFTISNLGMYGVDRFRAIINPPQNAILAAGRVTKRPVGLPDDTIALRPMMSLTLTVDHRSMDGIQGAKLLGEIKARLENPFFLL